MPNSLQKRKPYSPLNEINKNKSDVQGERINV